MKKIIVIFVLMQLYNSNIKPDPIDDLYNFFKDPRSGLTTSKTLKLLFRAKKLNKLRPTVRVIINYDNQDFEIVDDLIKKFAVLKMLENRKKDKN